MNRILAALGAALFAVFSMPASAAQLGEHTVLVINANWLNNTAQPWTPLASRDMVNVNVNNFYAEIADPDDTQLDPLRFTATSVGWWTLPLNDTECTLDGVRLAAAQTAADHGVDVTLYQHVIIAMPSEATASCTTAGTFGHNQNYPYTVAWIFKNTLSSAEYYFKHELGHNLRNLHAHGVHCGTVPLIASAPTGCTTYDGGWLGDIMGVGNAGHFNALAKWDMGWIDFQEVTVSGTHTLQPIETTPDALRVLRSTDPTTGLRQWIVAERRQCIGVDIPLCNLTNQNYTTGVVLTLGVEAAAAFEGPAYHAYEIDMAPATINNFVDAALQVGQCWQDPLSGISFETVTSTPGGAATVYVSMTGGCEPPPPPPPTNNPPVANDDSTTAAPGQSILIPVLANDSDPDGDPLTIVSVTQPSKGTAAIEGNQVRYTAPNPWRGKDSTSFTYTISDGQGGTASAMVTVNRL